LAARAVDLFTSVGRTVKALFPVAAARLTSSHLRQHLERCGYSSSHLLEDVRLPPSRTVNLAGFSQRPFDTRSACFAAMDVTTTPESDAAACRSLGAPVIFLCAEDHLLWWKQTEETPVEYQRIPAAHLNRFFAEHRDDFAPQTVYRAKTLGRFDRDAQREFVDLGLMPVVEQEAGRAIERLLLESVAELRGLLDWPKQLEVKPAQWLVKSVFWLLGAKMLQDKSVEGFIRMSFCDVDEVFARVGKHYGESVEGLVSSQQKRKALETVARRIAGSASLQLASTEALDYVYENTLISDQVRAEFGTHSTPSYLVDYVLGRLAPWIQELKQDERSVFEPGCGHGAFLVAAVRPLTSLLPNDMVEPAARRAYLRQRVRGCDADDFALEIARLSLTLADIPNPNGWNLEKADVFESNILETLAKKSTITLANPPFENLESDQRQRYSRAFRAPEFLNKATEILGRTFSAMPANGLFGVVVPQSILHAKNSAGFRRWLVDNCEFEEICLFPDKVFNFADHESAVLVGRKEPNRSLARMVRYRRVRERDMTAFQGSYAVTTEVFIPQSRFQEGRECDFRVPDLDHVWHSTRELPRLERFVDVGQGFSFIGNDQPAFPKDQTTISDQKFPGAVRGFENLGKDLVTHGLPPQRWLNLSPDVILRPRSGTTTGIPQVLVNEAPVQRAPWCVKAVIDRVGRPATTCFTILRPKTKALSLNVLWAFANSPIANAFAYAHSTKWHILTGTWRAMPVPDLSRVDLSGVEKAVVEYFAAVTAEKDFKLRSVETEEAEEDELRLLQWRIDAEVLRLYELTHELERSILDYFAGWSREGVPFKQERYFPAHFDEAIGLADYLAITGNWSSVNRRRLSLIAKKVAGRLSDTEGPELQRLKRLARAKVHLVAPLPERELAIVEQELRRKKLWKGE